MKLSACFDALRSLYRSFSNAVIQPPSDQSRASALDFLRVPQDQCLASCAYDLHSSSMLFFALTGTAVGEQPDPANSGHQANGTRAEITDRQSSQGLA